MRTELALQARGISRTYGEFRVLNDVNLQVPKGAVHALIGPNGAGKTTLFNVLSGFVQPTSGTVHWNGEDTTKLSPDEVARKGVVRSFQISATFGSLTVEENIRIALQKRVGEWFRVFQSPRALDSLTQSALDAAATVGLAGDLKARADSLSYGRKRALEIATTLALEPSVLLLDEPTAGMGGEDIERIVALIVEAAKGRTVLMVEHNLSIVKALASQVTVLARGSVLAEGAYDEIAADPKVVEAYVGAEEI